MKSSRTTDTRAVRMHFRSGFASRMLAGRITVKPLYCYLVDWRLFGVLSVDYARIAPSLRMLIKIAVLVGHINSFPRYFILVST